MLKPIILCLLLACAYAAQAQSTAQPSSAALQKCLLGTGDVTWSKLHLTPDQLERISRVQHACREECEGAGRKVDNPISNADGSTVMGEVKNILTTEQYQAWLEHCAQHPAGALPKQ